MITVPKRIMITGGLGTIGFPLYERMSLDDSIEVTLVDREHHKDCYRADISNYRQIERAVDYFRPEVVYHLAAEFGRENGEHYYEQCWNSNVVGTRHILELQRRYGFNMIFASSSEVYGECDEDFIHESYTEENPLIHYNDYAMTKWINEKQIRNYTERYGTKTMVLRFFNAYGPGEYFHDYRSVVCKFIYECLTGGEITLYEDYHRVFMFSEDFLNTLELAHDRFYAGETINVGGSEYVSVEEMFEIVRDYAGSPDVINRVPSEAMNVKNKRPNIEKAVKMLDHDPQTTLIEGIPQTVDWMADELGI